MTAPSTPQIPDELRPYLDTIADRLLSGHAAVMVGSGFSKNTTSPAGRACYLSKYSIDFESLRHDLAATTLEDFTNLRRSHLQSVLIVPFSFVTVVLQPLSS